MIFPKWLKDKDRIGVTAVSDGVNDPLDKKRFENAARKLCELGHEVVFTENVFTADEKGRSSSGKVRAKQFSELLDDEKIKCIIAAKGGNYLNEMLQYIDYEKICSNPIWFQGYSDNTCLIHTLTTKYDIATIYGNNFGDFGMEDWHLSVQDNLALLRNKKNSFDGYDMYQDGFVDRITGYEGYKLEKNVNWNSQNAEKVSFRGRLLGGCLDVLLFLQGTKYDNTLGFIDKYKHDKIIWYFESFATDSENLMLFLWKLKTIGWFEHCAGIIIGRPLFYNTYSNTSYEEAVLYGLGDLGVPIIFDCDFGHKPPRLPIINGAIATVTCENGRGNIYYHI
ncbi:MAG: LD-carboxypeptidase [Lachnospiraceae bacterium]|nr:LD-carboxypeptidase [Lachnospiraceae bacterium]